MVDAYGHAWSTDKGVSVDEGTAGKTWAAALMERGITRDELSTGISAMLGDPRFEEWPPKLNQFIALCRPNRPPHLRDEPDLPALPELPSSPARGEHEIRNCFATLGVSSDPDVRRRRQDRLRQRIFGRNRG